MASSKDVQEQFLSRVKQIVQDKCNAVLNSANTQMRSNIEPLKNRVIALEQENTLLREKIDLLQRGQTSSAVFDDKVLRIGGDIGVVKKAQSEMKRDIERIWLFMLQMHPDVEESLRSSAVTFQRTAIAANILRQARPEEFEHEKPPVVYKRGSDFEDLAGTVARLEATVKQLSSEGRV